MRAMPEQRQIARQRAVMGRDADVVAVEDRDDRRRQAVALLGARQPEPVAAEMGEQQIAAVELLRPQHVGRRRHLVLQAGGQVMHGAGDAGRHLPPAMGFCQHGAHRLGFGVDAGVAADPVADDADVEPPPHHRLDLADDESVRQQRKFADDKANLHARFLRRRRRFWFWWRPAAAGLGTSRTDAPGRAAVAWNRRGPPPTVAHSGRRRSTAA